jgi:hypothetical protein
MWKACGGVTKLFSFSTSFSLSFSTFYRWCHVAADGGGLSTFGTRVFVRRMASWDGRLEFGIGFQRRGLACFDNSKWFMVQINANREGFSLAANGRECLRGAVSALHQYAITVSQRALPRSGSSTCSTYHHTLRGPYPPEARLAVPTSFKSLMRCIAGGVVLNKRGRGGRRNGCDVRPVSKDQCALAERDR